MFLGGPTVTWLPTVTYTTFRKAVGLCTLSRVVICASWTVRRNRGTGVGGRRAAVLSAAPGSAVVQPAEERPLPLRRYGVDHRARGWVSHRGRMQRSSSLWASTNVPFFHLLRSQTAGLRAGASGSHHQLRDVWRRGTSAPTEGILHEYFIIYISYIYHIRYLIHYVGNCNHHSENSIALRSCWEFCGDFLPSCRCSQMNTTWNEENNSMK